jgi:hypothetical protein
MRRGAYRLPVIPAARRGSTFTFGPSRELFGEIPEDGVAEMGPGAERAEETLRGCEEA